MIKKILTLLLISFVGFVGFSSAWEIHTVGTFNPSIINNSYNVGVITRGGVMTQYLSEGKSVFYLGGNAYNYNTSFFYRDKNSNPYLYTSLMCSSRNRVMEGIPLNYSLCDEITENTSTSSGPSNCSAVPFPTTNQGLSLSGFFSSIQQGIDYYAYNVSSSSSCLYSFQICFSSSQFGKSICFRLNQDSSSQTPTTGSLNYSQYGTGITMSFISYDEIGNTPGANSGGGGNVIFSGGVVNSINISENDYDNYFNSRGYKLSSCFVGTDDLVSPYGTRGISFNDGGGKNIFEAFDFYASGFDNGTGDVYLKNVGIFLRIYRNNYSNVFGSKRFSYFGEYRPGGSVDNYFTGTSYYYDNQVPVALYFLGTELYNIFGDYDSLDDLVLFCNKKIRGGDYVSNVSVGSSLYNNVVGYSYSDRYNGHYYVNSSGNIVVSRDISSGGVFDNSWLNEGVDTGYDYSNYFSSFDMFFSALEEKFSDISFTHYSGIIPSYILFVLFLIVLFKLLRF